jgi:DNA-binding MarR family transcriptional regulator
VLFNTPYHADMSSSTPSNAAPPPCAEASLDDDFGWTLGVVFRSYSKAATAVVNDVPGGPRGYQVLDAAVRNQTGSQAALAKRLGCDRTVMTYLIDDLEAAGLVERRPDPSDRRNRRIVATERGQALWPELEKRLQRAEEYVLGPLDESERKTFRALLNRLAARANELDPLESACAVVADLGPVESPAPEPRHGPRRRS